MFCLFLFQNNKVHPIIFVMEIEVLSKEKILSNLLKNRFPNGAKSPYFAFYSSWSGGITFDAELMVVPVDDHLVHRGDGVFEAIKAVNGKPYLLKPHLERLQRSAAFTGLKLPHSLDGFSELIFSLIEKSRTVLPPNFLIRLFVSRGPGDFTTNPYSTVGSQVYIALTPLGIYTDQQRAAGVKIGLSRVPAKETWLAPYKTCNYIQNVLVKKESLDQNWDFSICVDAQGFITESSTENICWINPQGEICHPFKDRILLGTMMLRAFQLAEGLGLRVIANARLHFDDLSKQSEVFLAGTTLDVLRVGSISEQTIDVPAYEGSFVKKIHTLLVKDQQ